MFCRARSAIVRTTATAATSTWHLQGCLAACRRSNGASRFFGSRRGGGGGGGGARRRHKVISRRRVERADHRRISIHESKAAAEKEVQGEELLSDTGMKWGFVFTLGVLPMIAFYSTVSNTPRLRKQFLEFVGMQEDSAPKNTEAVEET